MKSDYIFESAQRRWEEGQESVETEKQLPLQGACPYCGNDLCVDRFDDTTDPWCETPKCAYDNGITEEANRALWLDLNR